MTMCQPTCMSPTISRSTPFASEMTGRGAQLPAASAHDGCVLIVHLASLHSPLAAVHSSWLGMPVHSTVSKVQGNVEQLHVQMGIGHACGPWGTLHYGQHYLKLLLSQQCQHTACGRLKHCNGQCSTLVHTQPSTAAPL